MNSKNYNIKKVNHSQFGYVVFTMTEMRIGDYLLEVEGKLENRNFRGKVLFDLLINNGKDDRFYEAVFDGRRILTSTFSRASSLSLETIAQLNSFYLKNIQVIEQSDFSNASKFLMKRDLRRIAEEV